MKDDKNLLEKPSVAFIFCSLCAFRLTAWFSLSFRKRVHHIDIFISFCWILFSKEQAYYIFIHCQYYIYCHFLFILRQFYWMALLLSSFKTDPADLASCRYLLSSTNPWVIMGGSLLFIKSWASIKTNHICTKRSYFLLFIHICFSYITKTITSFSIFYFFSSLQTLKTVV